MQPIRLLPAWMTACVAVLSYGPPVEPPQPAGDLLVYFGTYTGKLSQGVYVSRLDRSSGSLSAPQLAAATANPSFLAVHPSGSFLYAVNEVATSGGNASGTVSAFAIDRPSGRLALLNQESSAGADPAHLVVDRAGRNVLVANYSGRTVAVLPIVGDGRLRPATAVKRHEGSSVDRQRQNEPHPHGIALDRANRFAYVTDLGLDQVKIYRFDGTKGQLDLAGSAPVKGGSGPRHIAIRPDGRFAYVINEMACTITGFAVDAASGALRDIETVSTLPAGEAVAAGYSTAEIAVHPSGRFLYGSNRGHDTIAVFAIDAASGKLTLVEHEPTRGRTPRGFGIEPEGAYLIVGNQRSDSVVVMRIDAGTGALTPTGATIQVGSPVSVEFVSPASHGNSGKAGGGRPSAR
jgi:6-phosphogluconolactonase